jgi:hypothetical protein
VEPWEQWEQPSGGQPDDYFIVKTWHGALAVVSAQEARTIEDALDQVPWPRWIAFRDFSGARVRVRARDIVWIEEATAQQRAFQRTFNRARKAEKKADGWEDETP